MRACLRRAARLRAGVPLARFAFAGRHVKADEEDE
jgi:hypothetical protein